MSGVPDQVPVPAVSVEPTTGRPVTEGSADASTVGVRAAITAVAVDTATALPSALEATSRSPIVRPTSTEPTGYVGPVAASRSVQLAPSLSQVCHCRLTTTAPAQTPGTAVSVSPSVGVGLSIAGADVR